MAMLSHVTGSGQVTHPHRPSGVLPPISMSIPIGNNAEQKDRTPRKGHGRVFDSTHPLGCIPYIRIDQGGDCRSQIQIQSGSFGAATLGAAVDSLFPVVFCSTSTAVYCQRDLAPGKELQRAPFARV